MSDINNTPKKKQKVTKKIQDSIQNILENDIVANQSYVDENTKRIDDDSDEDKQLSLDFDYNWEEEFFKKFEWLENPTEKETEQLLAQKYKLFVEACKLLQGQFDISNEKDVGEDIHYNKLYLYFISLDNNCLFLHPDFKKSYDDVIKECLETYDYVKLNAPDKIIYVTEIHDLYDVDKYVKMFMHMFGMENTRGGSYTEIVLRPAFLETIEHEKTIANIEHYIKKIK